MFHISKTLWSYKIGQYKTHHQIIKALHRGQKSLNPHSQKEIMSNTTTTVMQKHDGLDDEISERVLVQVIAVSGVLGCVDVHGP